MAEDLQQAMATCRANIKSMLARVPEKIRNGSHQDSAKYKDLVERTNKTMARAKAKYSDLRQLENELRSFQ